MSRHHCEVHELRLRQAQEILNIAKAAGVKQVISSTTLGVSMLDDGVAVSAGSFMQRHMINKKSLEKMVEDTGFDHYTLLRPTFFMLNFLEPRIKRYAEIRDEGNWTTSQRTCIVSGEYCRNFVPAPTVPLKISARKICNPTTAWPCMLYGPPKTPSSGPGANVRFV